MATTVTQVNQGAISRPAKGLLLEGIRFDWIAAILSTFFTIGLFIDGWAHNHGRVDESFFTPWHAIFYGGFLLYGGFLAVSLFVNRSRGHAWRLSLPQGYELSLVGAAIFAAGGVGDLIWHTLFGIEEDIEALLSPTHLLLALGMSLMVSGPLRAAWRGARASGRPISWGSAGPLLISATMVLSIFAFLTQYAHPVVWWVGGEASETEDGSSIYLMNADGSLQTRLASVHGEKLWSSAWSPGGEQIVFIARDETTDPVNSTLNLMNADGSGLRELVALTGTAFGPAWSPDGSKIAFSYYQEDQSDIYLVQSDGSNLRPFANSAAGEAWPDWSPDGSQLAYTRRDPTGTIVIASADGSISQELPVPLPDIWGPAWSPDGSRIAFTSDGSGNSDVYTIRLDGSGLTQITEDAEWDGKPDWSPDGNRLVFTTWRNDNEELYTARSDGSDEQNLSNNPALEADVASWSPDGERILFSASGHSTDQWWLTQPLGISSVLLQSLILMGFVLLVILRWRLPFGSLALIFGLNTLMMSFLNDAFSTIIAFTLAGLIGDAVYVLLRPAERRSRFYLFAFLVPVIAYSFYFATVAIKQGLGWTIHLWAGTVVLAGVASLLLAILLAQGQRAGENETIMTQAQR